MNKTQFIVPIKSDSKLFGTGLLHKSFLITAAHVVKKFNGDFTWEFQNRTYNCSWNDLLFYEYDKEKKGTYRDLAIFKIDLECKGLSLSERIIGKRKALLYGYYEDEDDSNNVKINESLGCIRLEPYFDGKINISVNKNTFLLMDFPEFHHCNSGCPILLDEKVVGILSMGEEKDRHYCRCVSSEHILFVNKCIDTILKSINQQDEKHPYIERIKEVAKKNRDFTKKYGELILYNLIEEIHYIEFKAIRDNSANILDEIEKVVCLYMFDHEISQHIEAHKEILDIYNYFRMNGIPSIYMIRPQLGMQVFYDGQCCTDIIAELQSNDYQSQMRMF